VLEKSEIQICKPADTPVATGIKAAEDSELFDTTLYQSIVRMLLYLSDQTSHLLSILPDSVPKNIGWQLSVSWLGYILKATLDHCIL